MLPVRRAMPSMGPLDVTPIIVLFTILLLRNLIHG